MLLHFLKANNTETSLRVKNTGNTFISNKGIIVVFLSDVTIKNVPIKRKKDRGEVLSQFPG